MLQFAEFTDNFGTISSNLHLEAVQFFYPIGITWRNGAGPFCLQPVSRNRDPFAYIMTFHFPSELSD